LTNTNVGNLFLNLSLNFDKKKAKQIENDAEKVANSSGSKFTKKFNEKIKGIGGGLKSALTSKLGLASVIGGIALAIGNTNKKLKESVDYWDNLQTQADGLKISIEDMQKLKLVGELGDMPDTESFLKNVLNFKKSMNELKLGQDTEGARMLAQVGLKGNENIFEALKSTILSLKESDQAVSELALPTLFGKINTANQQFLLGGGLNAFEKVNAKTKSGEIKLLSGEKSAELGVVDEIMKIQEHNKKVEEANNINVSTALSQLQATQNIEKTFNKLLAEAQPQLGKIANLISDIFDFMKKLKIPSIISFLGKQ